MILLCSIYSFGQEVIETDSLNTSAQDQIAYMLEHVDKNEISTGLLEDISLSLIPLELFDGSQLTSENLGSPFNFASSYATIYSMSVVNGLGLPHPSDYGTKISAYQNNNKIPIGIIHYEYNEIKSYAFDQNLLSASNGQIYDVYPRSESPYETKQIFTSSCFVEQHEGYQCEFRIDAGLFYRNHNKTISQIIIDPGNGEPELSVGLNQDFHIAFESSGVKNIQLKISYTDGSTYFSQFSIEILEPQNNRYNSFANSDKYFDVTIQLPPPFNKVIGATAHIFYACGNTTLQKPFIWCEGFNPSVFGNLQPSYMHGILFDPNSNVTGNFDPLRYYLDQEGYDLVYVDYHDGGDYIENNAALVRLIIEEINHMKMINGSQEQNVVLGESMGGLVARYALRSMELDGLDHDTHTFITLDSPHNGANIPLCIQYLARHIPHIQVGSGSELWEFYNDLVNTGLLPIQPFNMLAGEQALSTPAARQMLLYQAPNNFNNQSTGIVNPEHIAFMQQYTAMGNPTECKVLMTANGTAINNNGGHGFGPLGQMIYAKTKTMPLVSSIFGNGWGFVFWVLGGDLKSEFDLRALPQYSNSYERIYKGKLKVNVPFVGQILHTNESVKVKEVNEIDNTPGAYPANIQIPFTVLNNAIFQQELQNGNLVINMNRFNYIPTYSALDIGYSNKANANMNLTNLSSTNILSSADRTAFIDQPFYYLDQNVFGQSQLFSNSLHIHLYPRNTSFLYFHLIGADHHNDISTISNGSFNFGIGNVDFSNSNSHFENYPFIKTSSRIDGMNHITSSGQVFVNVANKIGFIQTDNGPYTVLGSQSDPTNFTVYLGGDCSNNNTLLVDNGGLLYIGDNEYQTGELHLLPGASLTIGNSGALYIRENSRIVVHPGAELVLETGSYVQNHGDILLLGQPNNNDPAINGILTFNNGANLSLADEESELIFRGGNLYIGENATFSINHSGFSESGQITIDQWIWGQSIDGGNNSKILMNGKNPDDVILEIKEHGDFWTSDNLLFVKIDNGTIDLKDDARLVSVPNYFSQNAKYVGVEGNRGLVPLDITTIVGCEFQNTPVEALLFYKGTGTLSIFNSTFSDFLDDYNIYVQGRGYNMQNVTFESDVLNMIESQSITQFSNITNCTFNGNQQNGYVASGLLDNSDAEIQITSSQFNDNYYGVRKFNGRLNLRCNAFNNFFWSGVDVYNNCWLEMSSASKNGYNTFDKFLAGTPHNIGLNCAEYMQIKFGYNRFDDDGNTPIIEGSVQIGPPNVAKQYMHAHKNEWDIVNGVIPGPGRFDITSCITNSNIPLIVVDPQAAACGAFDPEITTPIGVGSMNGTKKLTTTHFNNEKMADAVNYTIKQTERFDDQKNDLFALELFEEILTYDYNNPNKETTWLIQYTSEYMKHTVQHCFTTGKITREGNETGFCGGMQRYANVLNVLTEDDINDDNYERMFYLEMDKVHLFHMLGNYDLALDLLYNMEFCGLDFQEQRHVNDWKYKLEVEKAKFEYGFEAEFLDTMWVDTSNYFTPTNQAYGNFGSTIINEKTIIFYNCNNPKAPLTENAEVSFDLYPNPTTGVTYLTYSVEKESEVVISVTGIDGKIIKSINCPKGSQFMQLDVSLIPAGVYIVEFSIDGVRIDSKKLVKN